MKADHAWQELYEAAALETDDEKLAKRLQVAKAGIDARILVLRMDHLGTPEERQAISAALIGLDVLRRDLEARSHETGSTRPECP